MHYGKGMRRWLSVSLGVVMALPLLCSPCSVNAAKSIGELEQGKQRAQNELNQLDNELVNLLADINVLERNIEENRTQIADVKDELKAARAAEAKQYEDMKVRMRYMYENGQESVFTMLLEAGSIADFLNRVSYANAVYEYDRGLLASYEATAEAIHDMQVALKLEQAELQARESELKTKQGALNAMIATKRSEVANFDSQLRAAREAAARRAAELARREAEARARANAAAVSRQAEIERRRQEEAARQAAEQEQTQSAIADDSTSPQKKEEQAGESKSTEETTMASVTQKERKTTTSSSTDEDEDDYIDSSSDDEDEDEDGGVYDGSDDDDEDYDEVYDGSGDDDDDYYDEVYDETASSSSSSSSSDSSSDYAGSTSVSGSSVASYASQFVGNPYVWGGNSLTSGCDCSGFVVQVYSHFGVDLSATRTSGALEGVGQSVSYENIQPGDIVCYPGHVAIYAGGGRIVEAQSSKTGITSNRSVTCSAITAIRRVI